ncbi:MAG: siphovirus ReqiPepy6 Gp37-like family protein [Deltaproteobacteria bacterium]|nr:siphovirus ReqiPepy6 Gp37-like family protein [Deltaproteobacteria bacterium]
MSNPYTLFIREESTLDRVGQLDQFISFISRSRFNGIGTWVLELDYGNPLTAYLGLGYGIVLQRGADVIFSGPINSPEVSWELGNKTFRVSGFDDLSYLTRRLALPEPSTASPPYNTDEFDNRTGVGSTIIRQYVDYNIGPNARTARIESGFTLAADPAIGDSITGNARYHNLLDFIVDLALDAGGLGLQVLDKEFSTYTPTDLSASIVFSEGRANLNNYNYLIKNPQANYIFVGDEDEGTVREIVERSDGASISSFGVFESFLDKSDTTVTAELQAAGDIELAQKKEIGSVSFEPRETNKILYQQDYKLGDQVKFRLDASSSINDVIREVEIEISQTESRTRVSIATSEESTNPELFRLFAGMNKKALDLRLSKLERK